MPTLTRNTANLIAGILALALVGGLVIRTSTAFFTAETSNVDNSLEAGTIVLEDDDDGNTALTMANIAPGEFSENCILVTYDGSLDPEPVLVYSTSTFVTTPAATGPGTAAASMEDEVRITILEGDGSNTATFDDCTGFDDSTATTLVDRAFLGDWDSTDVDYTTGTGTWDPGLGPGQERRYKIILELDIDTDNQFQGALLEGIDVTWSTRSTATPGLVP